MVLSLASAIPVFLFIYQSTDRLVLNELRKIVADETAFLAAEARAAGPGEVAEQIEHRIQSGAAAHSAFLLVDEGGAKIAGNIGAWPPTVAAPTGWAEVLLYRSGHSRPEWIGLSATPLPSGSRLLVGRVMDDRVRLQSALAAALAGALLLGIPVGLLGSLVLVRFINGRVRSVAAVAGAFAGGDLDRRVPSAGTRDPFDELGASLNAMLERIQQLVEELRFVTDGLAHDLRSPLTRIQASTEKALRAADPQTCRSALETVEVQIGSMIQMLNSSLEVSRAEAGIGRENFTQVDLVQLAKDLCEMYQPLAEEHRVSIEVDADEPLNVPGNRELLGEALSNLIDNALKYGASGGAISIGVAQAASAARLTVSDRGPGIAEEKRDEALRKYRRLDPARATDGSGLGLALVGAVAHLHGGKLVLENNAPGLRAVILLPTG
jgi:signal transduction histidine kinase